MALRKFNPTTPGQRHKVAITFDEITTSTPEKSLLAKKKRSGGRNDTGKMTIENIGGGHKKRYRIIDFKRNKFGIPAPTALSAKYVLGSWSSFTMPVICLNKSVALAKLSSENKSYGA